MSTWVQGLQNAGTAARVDWLKNELAVVERPEGVGDPDPLFGTDHSGDAAVHIIFPVTTKIKLTKARISRLANFSEKVHDRVRELGLKEIAYVRFREIKR